MYAVAIAYMITVAMIFHDIKKRYDMYFGLVAEATKELDGLESRYSPDERAKIDKNRAEELARRLAGKK